VFVALPPGASAATPTERCVLERYAPTAIAPSTWTTSIDYYTRTERGATLFVPAASGLTREWLELSLQRELAGAARNTDATHNPPDAEHIRANVRSADNGYWVGLTEPDESAAAKRRAWAEGVVQTYAARYQRAHATR
jgi:hypothetical protein